MSIQIHWLGTDGSSWDLLGGPVRTSVAGITGLSMPELEDQTKATALRDGQRLTGWKLAPREVWFPLRFKDAGAVDVEGVQRAFWRSVAIGEYGTLTVTDGAGATRSIQLRFLSDGGMPYRLDPYILSEAFGLTMLADFPWWRGPALDFSYSILTGDPLPTFFGNGAGATPFYINPNSGAESQTITNDGDAPAWVEWHLNGPFTSFRLGVDGHYVGGNITATAGQELVIETDPLRQLATLDGTKVTRLLAEVDWAPVPKTQALPVSIVVVGEGVVTARISPKYSRAL